MTKERILYLEKKTRRLYNQYLKEFEEKQFTATKEHLNYLERRMAYEEGRMNIIDELVSDLQTQELYEQGLL